MKYEVVSDELRSASRRHSQTSPDPLVIDLIDGKTIRVDADEMPKSSSSLYKTLRALGYVLRVRSMGGAKIMWAEKVEISQSPTEIPVEGMKAEPVRET